MVFEVTPGLGHYYADMTSGVFICLRCRVAHTSGVTSFFPGLLRFALWCSTLAGSCLRLVSCMAVGLDCLVPGCPLAHVARSSLTPLGSLCFLRGLDSMIAPLDLRW